MKNIGVKYGVYAGIIAIVIELLTYLMGPSIYFHWSKGILGFIILVAAMAMAGKAFKESNGGYATWKELLTPTFVVGIVSSIISTIFQFLMFNVIDTSLASAQKEAVISTMEGYADVIGEEGMEKFMDNLESQTFGLGPAQVLQTILVLIIFSFIIAAIVSAIQKRNRAENEIV